MKTLRQIGRIYRNGHEVCLEKLLGEVWRIRDPRHLREDLRLRDGGKIREL